MTDKEILDKVILIASKYSGIETDKLHENSSVNFDLQIDGDDIEEMIEEMIEEINKEFVLNFDGFNFSRY
ncbi:MAG: hypothetical protein AAF960_01035 [Bacteroidota bacterium]